jgi:hypothetical protein
LATVQGVRGDVNFEPTGSRRTETESVALWLVAELLCTVGFVAGGFLGSNMVLIGVGAVTATSAIARTFDTGLRPLQVGALLFWILVASQMGVDLWRNEVSADHLLVLVGLPLMY